MRIFLIILIAIIFLQHYNPAIFWESHYTEHGVNDRSSIGMEWDKDSIDWHNQFIEGHIYNYVYYGLNVLDIGSGSGHWVEYYLQRRCEVDAVEISQTACAALKAKYPKVNVFNKDISDFVPDKNYYNINAIRVLHHIVEDSVLVDVLKKLSSCLVKGGNMFISTQLRNEKIGNPVYKKYRDFLWWQHSLAQAGLEMMVIYIANEPVGIKGHDDLIVVRKDK